MFKLSMIFTLWAGHSDVNHVFRARSLLKDSIPVTKFGMEPGECGLGASAVGSVMFGHIHGQVSGKSVLGFSRFDVIPLVKVCPFSAFCTEAVRLNCSSSRI